MHCHTITKVALALFVALFVVSPSSVKCQGLQSELAQRVKAFDSERSSIVGQLVDFAQRFQIPMGIELANESQDERSSKKQLTVRAPTTRSLGRATEAN
jgi:hypothetical protein